MMMNLAWLMVATVVVLGAPVRQREHDQRRGTAASTVGNPSQGVGTAGSDASSGIPAGSSLHPDVEVPPEPRSGSEVELGHRHQSSAFNVVRPAAVDTVPKPAYEQRAEAALGKDWREMLPVLMNGLPRLPERTFVELLSVRRLRKLNDAVANTTPAPTPLHLPPSQPQGTFTASGTGPQAALGNDPASSALPRNLPGVHENPYLWSSMHRVLPARSTPETHRVNFSGSSLPETESDPTIDQMHRVLPARSTPETHRVNFSGSSSPETDSDPTIDQMHRLPPGPVFPTWTPSTNEPRRTSSATITPIPGLALPPGVPSLTDVGLRTGGAPPPEAATHIPGPYPYAGERKRARTMIPWTGPVSPKRARPDEPGLAVPSYMAAMNTLEPPSWPYLPLPAPGAPTRGGYPIPPAFGDVTSSRNATLPFSPQHLQPDVPQHAPAPPGPLALPGHAQQHSTDHPSLASFLSGTLGGYQGFPPGPGPLFGGPQMHPGFVPPRPPPPAPGNQPQAPYPGFPSFLLPVLPQGPRVGPAYGSGSLWHSTPALSHLPGPPARPASPSPAPYMQRPSSRRPHP